MNVLFYITLGLLLFVALILILLILIQKGRGGGLSSAFGGSGGSTAFGAKTGDVLTWATSIVFGVFILLAVVLDLLVNARYASPVTTAAVTPGPTATAVVPAVGPSQADRIAEELARQQRATTMPASMPVLPEPPSIAIPTTLPSVIRPLTTMPAFTVPSLPATRLTVPVIPATPPVPAVPTVPAAPATTRR